jgi:hypothetical protein
MIPFNKQTSFNRKQQTFLRYIYILYGSDVIQSLQGKAPADLESFWAKLRDEKVITETDIRRWLKANAEFKHKKIEQITKIKEINKTVFSAVISKRKLFIKAFSRNKAKELRKESKEFKRFVNLLPVRVMDLSDLLYTQLKLDVDYSIVKKNIGKFRTILKKISNTRVEFKVPKSYLVDKNILMENAAEGFPLDEYRRRISEKEKGRIDNVLRSCVFKQIEFGYYLIDPAYDNIYIKKEKKKYIITFIDLESFGCLSNQQEKIFIRRLIRLSLKREECAEKYLSVFEVILSKVLLELNKRYILEQINNWLKKSIVPESSSFLGLIKDVLLNLQGNTVSKNLIMLLVGLTRAQYIWSK